MSERTYELLFLRYFPGLRPEDFTSPNGFPVDWWDTGRALIDRWLRQGI